MTDDTNTNPFDVLSISDVRWLDAGHTQIGAMVRFRKDAAAQMFAVMANDSEAHGQQLWTEINAGVVTTAPGPVDITIAAYVAPIASALTKADLKAYAASVRYAKETGGISIGGAPVATDRESQAMINGAWSSAQMNADFTTDWKNADGSWTTLNKTQITAIAGAVSAHVAACFTVEKTVDAAIDGSSITSKAQIDSFAWPST